MKLEIDKFLDEIDEWKFKLYEKLKDMTPEEEAEFWQQSLEKAHARGFPIMESPPHPKRKPKRKPRATG
jgi:hypothetical protein